VSLDKECGLALLAGRLLLALLELEALLTQIPLEHYKFYHRWDVLLSSDRGTRRCASVQAGLEQALQGLAGIEAQPWWPMWSDPACSWPGSASSRTVAWRLCRR
jgi:hypothetical protein